MARNWPAAGDWSAEANLLSSSILRGQYHLDETVNPVLDSSGNGNHLTLTSTTTTGQPGIAGSSVSFGPGISAAATDSTVMNMDTQLALTMSAWVYPTSFPSSAPILVKEGAYLMAINNGYLQA